MDSVTSSTSSFKIDAASGTTSQMKPVLELRGTAARIGQGPIRPTGAAARQGSLHPIDLCSIVLPALPALPAATRQVETSGQQQAALQRSTMPDIELGILQMSLTKRVVFYLGCLYLFSLFFLFKIACVFVSRPSRFVAADDPRPALQLSLYIQHRPSTRTLVSRTPALDWTACIDTRPVTQHRPR